MKPNKLKQQLRKEKQELLKLRRLIYFEDIIRQSEITLNEYEQKLKRTGKDFRKGHRERIEQKKDLWCLETLSFKQKEEFEKSIKRFSEKLREVGPRAQQDNN